MSTDIWKHPILVLQKFLRHKNGGMLPLAAASMLSLAGFVGLAVDGARLIHGRDVLQKALDAGGLAAGHAAELADMTGDGQAFFDANISAAGGSGLIDPALTMSISQDNRVITLAATADIDTTFMRLFGFGRVSVSAATEVTRETRGMELSLVMDNTGSMRSGNKIGAMRDAAKDLIDIVFGDEEINPNLWVSLVPYTAAVNVGSGRADWLTAAGQGDVSGSTYDPTSWKGCVMARGGAGDQSDDTPGFDPFVPFFWQDSIDNDWIDGGSFDLDEANGAQNEGRGPNLGCGPAITPLTATKSTVVAAIDEMLPWHRGGTASNLGLVWGWRTLSPGWRSLWGGATPNNLPLDYDEPFMDKVIVVLTDGQNQFFDWQGGGPDGSDFTAYDRLNIFGFATLNDARQELDNRFASLCTAIKQTGIIIYAITFGSTPNGSTQSLYRNCASNESFYHHAPNNDVLQDVFQTIGRQLSNLRLSQ